MKYLNIPDEYVYGFIGSISSITFMTILDFIGTLVMAFLIGICGSIGGILAKKIYDKFKKK